MEKLTLKLVIQAIVLIFESVVFMDGVACGDAVFSAIEMNLSSEQNNNNRNIGSGWQ